MSERHQATRSSDILSEFAGRPDDLRRRRFAVAVVGPDHPGIISTVSGGLLTLGCNLEDVSTTVLRGHFSMMLVISAPAAVSRGDLDAALSALGDVGMSCGVWPVGAPSEADDATHSLTIYGRDTTGIVHAITRELTELG